MRPLSLTLQAFGSYAGELHVDFARLSRHGIFVISGPTGAGKSTIFDALVYALYDDLPGFRVDGNVRSQFAAPSTPTWVSLDFVVHGERWRVERCPAQLVGRRRGQGAPIEKKSTVVLGRLDEEGELVPGTVSSRKDEVRRRIDALVGLTKDQFEQVVLIPQGRFEEVLKADTSKRAPLLRRLFPVEVFTRLTESLKSISMSRQAEYEGARRAVAAVEERLAAAYDAAVAQLPAEVGDTLFGAEEVPEFRVERLGQHAGELTEALRQVDELVAVLRSKAGVARCQLEEARRAAEDWDRWQADVVLAASFDAEETDDADEGAVLERARRLADLRGVLAGWEDARRRSAMLEPELASLVEEIEMSWPDDLAGHPPAGAAEGWPAAWSGAREDAHLAGVLAERLAVDARRLDEEARRFDRLVETGRSLELRRVAVEERRTEVAERELKLDAEEQDVVLIADEAQRLRTEAAALDALNGAVSALEREHRTASTRAAAAAELAASRTALAEAVAAAEGASAVADVVRRSWRDGLAGRLARFLEDGVPCPTCGALGHPAPAEWREDGADDEALCDAEAARDEAIRVRGLAERRVAAAGGVVDALAETRPLGDVESDLAVRRGELDLVRDAVERSTAVAAEEARRRSALLVARQELGEMRCTAEAERTRLEADASAHASEVQAFVELHGSFDSPGDRAGLRRALAGGLTRLAILLKDVERVRNALRQFGGVIESVVRELGAREPGELLSWLLEPDEIDLRSAALEERRTRRRDVRRRIAEYEVRARPCARDDRGPGEAGSAGGDIPRPAVDPLEAALRVADAEHFSVVERRAVLADRAAVLASGPDDVAEARRQVDAARTLFEQAKTVADRCAGLGGGPVSLRLSLENWVLADYLRQVLVQANCRLDAMTDGRFALQLSDGVTDGRKPWGLDLSVFDANTGQVRPATTLSGGETFMAALALALGLADVVSGGSNRAVGALFVDEGFGSLDPQSLDAVVEVLRSLEDGGRVVGIISHVRELQQALPAGITVEPSVRGSRATLHYPPD